MQLTQEQVDAELDELVRNHRASMATIISANANSVVSLKPPSVQPAIEDDLDNKRDVIAENYSSFSVYKYFLRPAGIVTVIIWLILKGIAAASERLPSKPHIRCLPCKISLIIRIDVYIRIWLEEDASNYLYYIGYALFCLAHLILNGSTVV